MPGDLIVSNHQNAGEKLRYWDLDKRKSVRNECFNSRFAILLTRFKTITQKDTHKFHKIEKKTKKHRVTKW